jgi:very-short-patch-repair endonuclease
MVKLTTEEYINKAKLIWNNLYDYSQTIYSGSRKSISFICNVHGSTTISRAQIHIASKNPRGCKKCSVEKSIENRRKTKYSTEELLQLCQEKYQEQYDYSETVFQGMNYDITVKCNIHNIYFTLKLNSHLRPETQTGCSECGKDRFKQLCLDRKITKEEVLKRAFTIWGNEYIYPDDIKFDNMHDKISVICRIHGPFSVTPQHHLHKTKPSGCPKCSQSKGEKKISEYLEKNHIVYVSQFKVNRYIWDITNDYMLGYDDINEIGNIKNKPFDFYLPDYDLMIEYDGEQHEQPVKYFGGVERFEKQQKIDATKTNYCLQNGIELLRISYRDFQNIENILEKILTKYNQ